MHIITVITQDAQLKTQNDVGAAKGVLPLDGMPVPEASTINSSEEEKVDPLDDTSDQRQAEMIVVETLALVAAIGIAAGVCVNACADAAFQDPSPSTAAGKSPTTTTATATAAAAAGTARAAPTSESKSDEEAESEVRDGEGSSGAGVGAAVATGAVVTAVAATAAVAATTGSKSSTSNSGNENQQRAAMITNTSQQQAGKDQQSRNEGSQVKDHSTSSSPSSLTDPLPMALLLTQMSNHITELFIPPVDNTDRSQEEKVAEPSDEKSSDADHDDKESETKEGETETSENVEVSSLGTAAAAAGVAAAVVVGAGAVATTESKSSEDERYPEDESRAILTRNPTMLGEEVETNLEEYEEIKDHVPSKLIAVEREVETNLSEYEETRDQAVESDDRAASKWRFWGLKARKLKRSTGSTTSVESSCPRNKEPGAPVGADDVIATNVHDVVRLKVKGEMVSVSPNRADTLRKSQWV